MDCENLLLTVHPERVAYFRLMAADKVQVKRVETSFSARLLTIEDGRMTYAGAPKLRINWSLPVSKPPTQKK